MREKLFDQARETFGDDETLVNFYEGIECGVRLMAMFPQPEMMSSSPDEMATRLFAIFQQAHSQGVDLQSAVFDLMNRHAKQLKKGK